MLKREPLCTVGRNINWCSHYGKQYGASSKNYKSSCHIWSNNSTSGYIYTGNETSMSKRYLQFHVHWSIIHNNQDMEIIYASVSRWIGKKKMEYICVQWNIIVYIKERNPLETTWMNLEGILLSEITQTKTNTVQSHIYIYVQSKKANS